MSLATVGWTAKSELIASWICSRWPISIPASAPSSSRRCSSVGNGSARNAARWRSTISCSSAIAAESSAVDAVRFSVSAIAVSS